MKIFKQSFVIGIIMLIRSYCMAQEVMLTEEQEAIMNQHIRVYFEELGLSEDQKQVFKKITKKYALKMKTLKRDNDSKYANYRKLKSIKKSKNKEMKILLNAEQFKKYEENEEKRNKEKAEKGFF